MKDGYYYFIPAVAGKTDVDKSLGYVCVTKYPRRSSIPCSAVSAGMRPRRSACRER